MCRQSSALFQPTFHRADYSSKFYSYSLTCSPVSTRVGCRGNCSSCTHPGQQQSKLAPPAQHPPVPRPSALHHLHACFLHLQKDFEEGWSKLSDDVKPADVDDFADFYAVTLDTFSRAFYKMVSIWLPITAALGICFSIVYLLLFRCVGSGVAALSWGSVLGEDRVAETQLWLTHTRGPTFA